MTGATRYFCPLDCGWHHDQPGIDFTDPDRLYPIADIPVPEGVDPIAHRLAAGQLLTVDTIVKVHLETHGLLDWAQAVRRVTDERDRATALADARRRVIDRMARESLAAEAVVERVRDKATEWTTLAPADDWGMTPTDTVLADAGRYLLALIDQPGRTATSSPKEQP